MSDLSKSLVKSATQFARAVSIPLLGIGIVALWSLRASNFVLRGALVTFALFILAAIANFWIKLSLHALFAFIAA